MKKIVSIVIAISTGILVIAALIFRPQFNPLLTLILRWGITIGSMAALVGIAVLIKTHFQRIAVGKRGFFFSLIVLFGFSVSFLGGMLLGVDNPAYQLWISSIQLPLEISFLGLLTLILTTTGFRLYRLKGWTPLSISFGISAVVFLIIAMGYLQGLGNPTLDRVIEFIQRLPIAGGRGILIGMALGALVVGIRVLIGVERPYGE